MKTNYDKNYYVVKAEDMKAEYNEQGFAMTELLPGVYDGGIRSFKCFLKAGSTVKPELFADKGVILFFGKGERALTDQDGVHPITELAFYVPNFDAYNYEVYAHEDMEFIFNIIEFNQWDKQTYDSWHIRLPYFRLHSECVQYIQSCKGPHTEARMVLCPKWFGRVILGTTRANGEGTVEKGTSGTTAWAAPTLR